jgi:hypothetical protein
METKSKMYSVSEPRMKEIKGEQKTVWNTLGVMFENDKKEGSSKSFSIMLDAHPIGEKLMAFEVDRNDQAANTPAK